MRSEVAFSLPYGFTDDAGNLHRDGVMRLATTLDEIAPLNDPRTQQNPAYLGIILIAKVLRNLGGFMPVPVAVIERLYAADFTFLQDLYLQLNTASGRANFGERIVETECPNCQTRFLIDLEPNLDLTPETSLA
jgi:hypothetical protein